MSQALTNALLRLNRRESGNGFSRVELLAVLAMLALLAGLAWTALSRAGRNAAGVRCIENLRRLTVAWSLYADAHGDLLLASGEMSESGARDRRMWVSGMLNAAGAVNRENWDAESTVLRSPLVAFAGRDAALWRCPADESAVILENRRVPRVRSYSMSSVFGTGYWLPAFRYRTYARRSQIAKPAHTFVLVDEHPDGINDGTFALEMVEPASTDGHIIDLPASRHGRGCGFSFADGHVELKQWVGKTIQQPVTYRGDAVFDIPARDSLPDVKWMSANCTVRR